MTNLHIKDALDSASPGTLIASRETTTLHGPLRALIGKDAANLVLKHAGRTGVLHMNEDELAVTAGIAPDLAGRLVAARRLFDSARRLGGSVNSSRHALGALPVGLGGLEIEVMLAIALDTRLAPIGTVFLAQGGATGAAIVPRDVFTPLVRINARAFILVHNHPSGTPTPSRDDIVLTNTVARLGRALDVRLVDHLIVGGDEICSFADLRLLPSDEECDRMEVSHAE